MIGSDYARDFPDGVGVEPRRARPLAAALNPTWWAVCATT